MKGGILGHAVIVNNGPSNAAHQALKAIDGHARRPGSTPPASIGYVADALLVGFCLLGEAAA